MSMRIVDDAAEPCTQAQMEDELKSAPVASLSIHQPTTAVTFSPEQVLQGMAARLANANITLGTASSS
ncbi:MAG: hypothetical protein COA94_03065 [Rickettsiales bacterium]|nr:MAG: hypothetical protein COA94_03065 [Rickettsiales bacterium]